MPRYNDDFVLERNVKTKNKDKTQHPKMFHIVLYNDDYTYFEFVMKVLYEIFEKTEAEAFMITLAVQASGEGIIGTFTEDDANRKADLIEAYKDKYNQPLLFDVREA